jgi:hypothetical protein
MIQRYFVLSGALFVVMNGCGGNEKLAPVSGVVKLNRKPVADVEVIFQPVTESVNAPGPAAFGVTGPDGRYTAKVIGEDKPGATIGKNQVSFSGRAAADDFSEDGKKRGKPAVSIPARYSTESKMTFDVPAKGTTTADFELKSP